MTLDELIPRYGELKSQADSLKKELDVDNATIKELMAQSDSTEYEVDGWVAKYSVQERESLDEQKLLQIIKDAGVQKEGLIKTVEILDMEVLEDLLYKDEIPAEVVANMDSCRSIKEVVTLRVSRKKKKKEDD